jgi:hypothetical protein
MNNILSLATTSSNILLNLRIIMDKYRFESDNIKLEYENNPSIATLSRNCTIIR